MSEKGTEWEAEDAMGAQETKTQAKLDSAASFARGVVNLLERHCTRNYGDKPPYSLYVAAIRELLDHHMNNVWTKE